MATGATVIDTPEGIEAFRLLAIKGRLSLELKGLKFKPLPGHGSTNSYVKNTWGFKGSREKVYAAYCDMLRERGILPLS
jgi:hypothetical protein